MVLDTDPYQAMANGTRRGPASSYICKVRDEILKELWNCIQNVGRNICRASDGKGSRD